PGGAAQLGGGALPRLQRLVHGPGRDVPPVGQPGRGAGRGRVRGRHRARPAGGAGGRLPGPVPAAGGGARARAGRPPRAAGGRARGVGHVTRGAYAGGAGAAHGLRLDADATANAVAIAGTSLNALRVTRTGALSNWKGLAYPNTAFGAVHAAFLARAGITGPA